MSLRTAPRWAVAALLAIPGAFGLGLAVSAAASSAPPTYYSCLHNGLLSKVSTVSHTCPVGYKAVSWNAVGPQGVSGLKGTNGKDGSSVACILVTLCTWGTTYSGASYGFSAPQGIASDGVHLWVANEFGDSVTELNAADGSWVRTLSGVSYGFNGPFGIAFDGTHLWVTNYTGNFVTELNASDGSWVRMVSGAAYAVTSRNTDGDTRARTPLLPARP